MNLTSNASDQGEASGVIGFQSFLKFFDHPLHHMTVYFCCRVFALFVLALVVSLKYWGY